MPVLQEGAHRVLGAVGALPGLQLGVELAQQLVDRVSLLTVLQLDAVVLSRHSGVGEPVGRDAVRWLYGQKFCNS